MKILLILILFFNILNPLYALQLKYNKQKQIEIVFESIIRNTLDIETCIQFNFFDNFIDDWRNIKTKLCNDNIDYGYEKSISGYSKTCTMNHIIQTLHNIDSLQIPEEEKKILRLIMFFHDLGKYIDPGPKHQKYSAKILGDTLSKLDYPQKDIDLYMKLIKYHDLLGCFPKRFIMLQVLSIKEINMLYYITLADIQGRKYFDTSANLRRIKKIRNAAYFQDNRKKLEEYGRRANYINEILACNSFKAIRKINGMCPYMLKHIAFNFVDCDNFKLIIKDIIYSV